MSINIRELVLEDLTKLSTFLGRTVTELIGDTLVALDDGGAIVGALSYSRIYSTWENKSMAVNSAVTSEADVLKRLLLALTKIAFEEGCARIDTYTSDQQLVAKLTELGCHDMTALADWNAFQLKNLDSFVSR